MAERDVAERLAERLLKAKLSVGEPTLAALTGYFSLLARWNERINLTAFDLADPSDAAIDRLIVEPVAAARHVRPADERMIDIGSGGGSPALPFRLVAPQLRLVLVESRTRKCAFLQEAVRRLGLAGVDVENARLEDLAAQSRVTGVADLVTLRAVRVDAAFWRAVAVLLRPGGRLFWFTVMTGPVVAPTGFLVDRSEPLAGSGDALVVFTKSG